MLIRIGIVAASTAFALIASPAPASTAIGSWQESLLDDTDPLPKGKRPFTRTEPVTHKLHRQKVTIIATESPKNEMVSNHTQTVVNEDISFTPSSELYKLLESLSIDEN